MAKAIQHSGKIRMGLPSQVKSIVHSSGKSRLSGTGKPTMGNYTALLHLKHPETKKIAQDYENPQPQEDQIPQEAIISLKDLVKQTEDLKQIVTTLSNRLKEHKKNGKSSTRSR